MATELHDLTAIELVAGYAALKISPVEVMRAVLDRADRLDPVLNCFYRIDHEGAIARATASEKRWRYREPRGALDGVPVTIKDGLAVNGWTSPRGTAMNAEAPLADWDHPVTARLKEAGAVLFAKTTMPDIGMLPSGVSSLHGTTRNPWNLARNPGGSSSGAGAAVATGLGPLAIGTDIGGSVRIPAGYCGIFGHKPSGGRVPYSVPGPMLAAGPMTRTVADAALAMTVITRPDLRDFMALPFDDRDYHAALDGASAEGLRVGLMLDTGFGLPLDPEVRAAVEAAAALLAGLGATVEPLGPMLTPELAGQIETFFRGRAWTEVSSYPPERRQRLLPYILDWVQPGASLTAVDVFRSMAALATLRERVVTATAAFDFVLSPVMPVPPFDAEAPLPDPARGLDAVCFTAPFNQTEQPAASVNCGYTTDGLPIGLHIVGRRHDDVGVLRLAKLYEDNRPAQRPWPEPA